MTNSTEGLHSGPAQWDRRSISAALRNGLVRGLRLWPNAPDVPEFRYAAVAADWVFYHLDTVAISDKREYVTRCQQDLNLPDYLGHNWDALEEALGDLPQTWPMGHAGVLVLWTGWSNLAAADPRAFQTTLDIWHDTVAAWRSTSEAAVVLSLPTTEVPNDHLHQVAALPRIRPFRGNA